MLNYFYVSMEKTTRIHAPSQIQSKQYKKLLTKTLKL